MNFRTLRVMNEDWVQPAKFRDSSASGYGDRDLVLEGALEHRDSMGNGEVLTPGEFQRMTAGTGITHSEFNPSTTAPVHLYQIWLYPERRGLEPSYEQKRLQTTNCKTSCIWWLRGSRRRFIKNSSRCVNLFRPFAARDAVTANVATGPTRLVASPAWSLHVHGNAVSAGDGVAISDETALQLEATSDAELLLFDLN